MRGETSILKGWLFIVVLQCSTGGSPVGCYIQQLGR